MPGFGVTSTNNDTLPPAAPTSTGAATMVACLEPGSPRNCKLGALVWAWAVVERRSRTKKKVFTRPLYMAQWLMAGWLNNGVNPNVQPLSHQPRRALLLPGFVDRARAAADCRADERALFAAEDGAKAGTGRRRAADHEGRLLPVAPAWPLH